MHFVEGKHTFQGSLRHSVRAVKSGRSNQSTFIVQQLPRAGKEATRTAQQHLITNMNQIKVKPLVTISTYEVTVPLFSWGVGQMDRCWLRETHSTEFPQTD